jgi:nucleoside-diphosphate-sugar epimerase
MFNPSPVKCRQFRQTRLLIVGCGDVGMRVARQLNAHVRLRALTSSPERCDVLRAAGVLPLLGNLDDQRTLRRLSGLAQRVLHLAPPPSADVVDPRTRHLLQALALRLKPVHFVYGSTTGVYGDAQGHWVNETKPLAPITDRAKRRVHAEALVRWWGRQHAGVSRVCVLRIPGIYAFDRAGGDPRDRIRRLAPLLTAADDVYTNHIHANDLARACCLALWRGPTQQAVNVIDDQSLKMGDYFDQVADMCELPRLPRVSKQSAQAQLSAMQWSFLSESRRLDNARLKQTLRLVLQHPDVASAWAAFTAIKTQ